MARFFRLVKNEYIKVFKKLSTKIMIVLIIICALGLSGIALFAKHNMESNNYSSYDATGDYQQTIDWLKDTNGDPNEIAMWQYLIDNDIDSDDWRYDVLSAVFANGTGDMSGIRSILTTTIGVASVNTGWIMTYSQRAKSGNINTGWTRIFPLTNQTRRKTILS